MLTATPNTPTKGIGLTPFSLANKQILEQNIKDALKSGFLATFMFDAGSDGEEMAQTFADCCGPILTDAIDSYVINAIKSQQILITPASLVSPVGPVTGSMSTLTDIQVN